ncbi:MAG: ABC transporter permease, partial [Myxococcota bacterium]
MIGHILQSGWRLLKDDLFFSVITILSLAVGCAAAVLVGGYLREEFSFEEFIDRAEEVARVEVTVTRPGTSPNATARAPSGLAAHIGAEVDSVAAHARNHVQWFTVTIDDAQFNQQVAFVDPAFFDVFALPVLFGDVPAAMAEPTSVILTADIAEKLLGPGNTVGKTFQLNPSTEVRVGAILERLPRTTHLSVEIIAPMESPARRGQNAAFDSELRELRVEYYVRAKAGQAAQCFAELERVAVAKIAPMFSESQTDQSAKIDVVATPIPDIHLSPAKTFDFTEHGDKAQLALFGAVALLILAVAGFNYITMSLARAVPLTREVGMRKALGATPGNIAAHYLGGSVVLTGASVLIGFSLAELMLPWFGRALGRALDMNTLHHPDFLLAAISGGVVVALAVGSYPAFFLARQPAAVALSGRTTGGRGIARVSHGLLLFQLGSATVLLVLVLTMLAQARFIAAEPLGFERSNRIVLLGVNYGPGQTGKRFQTVQNILRKEPAIRHFTAASAIPSWNYDRSATLKAPDLPMAPEFSAIVLDVAMNFFDGLGAKLVAGRDFDPQRGNDRMLTDNPFTVPDVVPVVISREAAKRLVGNNIEDAVGKVISAAPGGDLQRDVE